MGMEIQGRERQSLTFTFPNIHFAINYSNPMRFLFAQGV